MANQQDKEKVCKILRQMINGSLDLVSGCRDLTHLHHKGFDFIPIRFVGFDSELDSIPLPEQYHLWNPEALEKYLRKVEPYQDDIIQISKEILTKLEQEFLN
jgi:hypothetical protein